MAFLLPPKTLPKNLTVLLRLFMATRMEFHQGDGFHGGLLVVAQAGGLGRAVCADGGTDELLQPEVSALPFGKWGDDT